MRSSCLAELASLSLIAVVGLGPGCAPVAAPHPRGASHALAPPRAGAHTAHAATPERPPPPRITTPMQGEPDAPVLAEARLVSSGCLDLKKEQQRLVQERIQQMRAEIDAQFKVWLDAQPGCWQEYRIRAAIERGELFGGLGLSGIGEGGGGYGEGIGLGSIGTIGHGSGRLGGVQKARSASHTNNQVAGVDEADIVKTDGRYVYLAINGALRIMEALRPKVVSVTRIPGVVREMFVDDDRAVVYAASGPGTKRCTYGYDCQFSGDTTSTRVLVYDVTDRAAPRLAREIALSGSLMAARRIGNAVHTVVADGDSTVPPYQTWPDDLGTCGTPEAEVRAKFGALKFAAERAILASTRLPTIVDKAQATPICSTMLRTAFSDGRGAKEGRGLSNDGAFTTVVSFDLKADHAPATAATLKSRPGAIFASNGALYLSVVQRKPRVGSSWYSFYSSVDEASEIHKFRISANPADTRYVGSGVIPGHVLNQFAMDEWYGYLRIATTRGKVPDPRVHSEVSILAEAESGNLVRVGAVQNIAPGEDIRAVRFDGDRGYVVTFKKTDPLFVMDLYHPARPSILGELKIPGFSTYMHRIDPDHLLSIGFDANDHGDFAYFDGVILQLFDVKNPTQPRLLHKEKIGTRGSSSEAATNHLAFNYFEERGLLAIPMTLCDGGGDGRHGSEMAFSGLLVYDVDIERGFKRLGGIDHGKKGAHCGNWWSHSNSVVQRSVFLDELVYSIATDRLKVQRMGQLGSDLASIALLP
ncbi:MAG: beta-propeller domain-containing protein [Deltaproteobacteria bacterium]|nr:beta-propeller domain-containing protein [Deltaproteobacteria bacterium]